MHVSPVNTFCTVMRVEHPHRFNGHLALNTHGFKITEKDIEKGASVNCALFYQKARE